MQKTLLNNPIFFNKSSASPKTNIIRELIKKRAIVPMGKGLYLYGPPIAQLMDKLDLTFKEIFNRHQMLEFVSPLSINPGILKKMGYSTNFANKALLLADKKALIPAACLPVYVNLKGKNLKKDFLAITVKSRVFRNESAYANIYRMREFDMREIIFCGEKEAVQNSLIQAQESIRSLAAGLDLTFSLNLSHDDFYGTNAKFNALYQLFTRSKVELRAFSASIQKFVPIASFNYHGLHFSRTFQIRTSRGLAHTGCVGFGLQRWALIFLETHGFNRKKWPQLGQI
jgi:seryl-tRNA synthetase